MSAALGAALGAGLLVVLIDVLLTRSRAGDGGVALAAITAGLYALPVLLFGLAAGVVAGALGATCGPGGLARAYRRLGRDRDLDRQVTGALLATAVLALVLIMATRTLAMILVAGVERKSTGAMLLGLVVLVLVPVLALLGLPVYRLTRRIAGMVPRLGPVPASLSMLLAGLLGTLGAGLFFVFTQLEWRALNLGSYALLGTFPLLTLALLWLLGHGGPLAALRSRIPARGTIVAGAALVAVVLPLAALRGQPAARTIVLLTEYSPGARLWVRAGRSVLDRDGDGFSAFLGGPDCNDRDAAVNPDAREIPGNGIDDNCMGGDREAEPGPATAAGAPDQPAGETAGTPGQPAPATQARAKNVLFILVDTVRADRLGVAGYTRDGTSLTPNLDELARRSAYFTRAYAQAPNTPRSAPSIFASRFPSQIKVHKDFHNFPQVLDDNLMLFEVLGGAGFDTLGYASHFYFEERRNIHQGFALFDNEGALDIRGSNKDIASPRIVPKVAAKLAELGRSKARFAMFVHLFEPHSTYVEHDGYPITERGTAGLMQKYDYEIAYTDVWVGRILEALDTSGLAGDTMVVIASDHGEAFGVHHVAGQAMFFHGQTLYDELLRVPLIIHAPGVAAGVYDDVVMLVDLAPTIVEAAGLAIPDRFVGRSLLGRMLGQPLAPRAAYGELLRAPSWDHDAKMMVSADGKHKLLHRISDKRFELYNLERDPEERSDLSGTQPELLDTLKNQLFRWVEVDLQ